MYQITAHTGKDDEPIPDDLEERATETLETPFTNEAMVRDPFWRYQRLINASFPIKMLQKGGALAKEGKVVWIDLSNFFVSNRFASRNLSRRF